MVLFRVPKNDAVSVYVKIYGQGFKQRKEEKDYTPFKLSLN
jgi:hypothetical protein